VPSWRFLLNHRIEVDRDFLAEPQACVSEVAYAVRLQRPVAFRANIQAFRR